MSNGIVNAKVSGNAIVSVGFGAVSYLQENGYKILQDNTKDPNGIPQGYIPSYLNVIVHLAELACSGKLYKLRIPAHLGHVFTCLKPRSYMYGQTRLALSFDVDTSDIDKNSVLFSVARNTVLGHNGVSFLSEPNADDFRAFSFVVSLLRGCGQETCDFEDCVPGKFAKNFFDSVSNPGPIRRKCGDTLAAFTKVVSGVDETTTYESLIPKSSGADFSVQVLGLLKSYQSNIHLSLTQFSLPVASGRATCLSIGGAAVSGAYNIVDPRQPLLTHFIKYHSYAKLRNFRANYVSVNQLVNVLIAELYARGIVDKSDMTYSPLEGYAKLQWDETGFDDKANSQKYWAGANGLVYLATGYVLALMARVMVYSLPGYYPSVNFQPSRLFPLHIVESVRMYVSAFHYDSGTYVMNVGKLFTVQFLKFRVPVRTDEKKTLHLIDCCVGNMGYNSSGTHINSSKSVTTVFDPTVIKQTLAEAMDSSAAKNRATFLEASGNMPTALNLFLSTVPLLDAALSYAIGTTEEMGAITTAGYSPHIRQFNFSLFNINIAANPSTIPVARFRDTYGLHLPNATNIFTDTADLSQIASFFLLLNPPSSQVDPTRDMPTQYNIVKTIAVSDDTDVVARFSLAVKQFTNSPQSTTPTEQQQILSALVQRGLGGGSVLSQVGNLSSFFGVFKDALDSFYGGKGTIASRVGQQSRRLVQRLLPPAVSEMILGEPKPMAYTRKGGTNRPIVPAGRKGPETVPNIAIARPTKRLPARRGRRAPASGRRTVS